MIKLRLDFFLTDDQYADVLARYNKQTGNNAKALPPLTPHASDYMAMEGAVMLDDPDALFFLNIDEVTPVDVSFAEGDDYNLSRSENVDVLNLVIEDNIARCVQFDDPTQAAHFQRIADIRRAAGGGIHEYLDQVGTSRCKSINPAKYNAYASGSPHLLPGDTVRWMEPYRGQATVNNGLMQINDNIIFEADVVAEQINPDDSSPSMTKYTLVVTAMKAASWAELNTLHPPDENEPAHTTNVGVSTIITRRGHILSHDHDVPKFEVKLWCNKIQRNALCHQRFHALNKSKSTDSKKVSQKNSSKSKSGGKTQEISR